MKIHSLWTKSPAVLHDKKSSALGDATPEQGFFEILLQFTTALSQFAGFTLSTLYNHSLLFNSLDNSHLNSNNLFMPKAERGVNMPVNFLPPGLNPTGVSLKTPIHTNLVKFGGAVDNSKSSRAKELARNFLQSPDLLEQHFSELEEHQKRMLEQLPIFNPHDKASYTPEKLKKDLSVLAEMGLNVMKHDFGFEQTGLGVLMDFENKAKIAYKKQERGIGPALRRLFGLKASSLGDPKTKMAPVTFCDPYSMQLYAAGKEVMTTWMVLHALQAEGHIQIHNNPKSSNNSDTYKVTVTEKGLDCVETYTNEALDWLSKFKK